MFPAYPRWPAYRGGRIMLNNYLMIRRIDSEGNRGAVVKIPYGLSFPANSCYFTRKHYGI